MKVKFAMKRALKDLPFKDKKKLVDAVISPETGGCVYVRELEVHDLIDPTDHNQEENEVIPFKPPNSNTNKSRGGNFVLDLDFTLEPNRIIEIIQAMDKKVINQSGLLSIHSNNNLIIPVHIEFEIAA